MDELAAIAQSPRLLRIVTPLGTDALVLRRLSVHEAIGRLFLIEAEVLSAEPDLAPGKLMGQPATFTIAPEVAEERHFHGIVHGFSRLGPDGRGHTLYRLEAGPALEKLVRSGDCRIFQDQSVRAILDAVISKAGDARPLYGATVPSATRPYCVQFNETDLDFISRLLEEEGCGYFFRHEMGRHSLHVAGSGADYPMVPGEVQVVRSDASLMGALAQWQPRTALPTGRFATRDYDGLNPSALLQGETDTVLHKSQTAGLEIFRWPGGEAVRPGTEPARLLMEGAETGAESIAAQGSDPAPFAGGRLRVRAGLDEMAAATWLVTTIRHQAFDETHLGGGGGADYRNEMLLMPAERPWRPTCPRPRPRMAGLHCAIVTGPRGEEIHCDKHGRILVRFLWDRRSGEEANSCWVRVAQGFGGAWGGAWMLPRLGDEVLVGFVDGDPDRPVVVGSLYNAEQPPPFALPGQKTRSGLRTRSTKGGGADNFNMLMMDDEKGSEMFSVQAEKDLALLVKNDRTVKIGGNHTETVQGDRSATLEQGHESLVVRQGNISTKAEMGAIEMTAMQSITFKVGQNALTISQSGITLEAMMISLKAETLLDMKGALVKGEAQGVMTLKGGIVLIN